jgi:poly(3-hydroxybutyrate) depolymerase
MRPIDKSIRRSLVLTAAALVAAATAHAQIDCSTLACAAADQTLIQGYPMFNQANFAPIVDGFGRTRLFYVHIPTQYDTVDGVTQKVPLVFAFHGGGQTREAMIQGKWGDHFDQEVAFVIPLGTADPCDNLNGNGPTQWMQPGPGLSTSAGNPGCAAATQVVDSFGVTRTYWNASLPGTFTDVFFVETLRATLLARFPKLNASKVYATGFSSGGGMSLTLACYRSSLFRGFSVVAKMLAGDGPRGDYDLDGIPTTDPNSLVATCGKSAWDPGSAAGLAAPDIWGYGIQVPAGPVTPAVSVRVAKPIALFAGDQDNPLADINATGDTVRARNNLGGGFALLDPFSDTAADDATTQRRTFFGPLNAAQPSAAFRRFLVRGLPNHSATHAMPDAQECPPIRNFGDYFMTCDYDYTAETLSFWQDFADLDLNP